MTLFRIIVLTIAVLAPNAALAASGYIKGSLYFYQNQGNYCPTTRDCTGATYTQSQYNVNSPVSEVKVYLKNIANDAIIGQSTTGVNGAFTISWSSAAYPIQAEIYWTAQHKDGRFTVHTSTGTTQLLTSSAFTPTNGTTMFSPQNRGAIVWGSSGAPNQVANVYDGAYKTWNKLKTSNRMLTNFSGLSIRAFSNTCLTSCALGASNIVHLDTNAAFSPQGRVMHEMGHIASYNANYFKVVADYCYPSTGACGWSADTAEWKSASFEESMATFVGTAALYNQNAPAPHDCLSTGACATNSFDVETNPNALSCTTNEDRWPLSSLRFLWDIYDSVQENYIFAVDDDSKPFADFIDMLAAFPNGTNDHDDDEPWNSTRTAIDNYDGRAPEDFGYWFNVNGFNPLDQRAINCNP